MNKKYIIIMKRRFLFLFVFAALVPFSACSNQAFAQKHAHHHLCALSDVGFIQAVTVMKHASLAKFQKNLPSNPIATSRAIDPGATFTAYVIFWAGNLPVGGYSSCPPTDPALNARCGGQGTIEIMDEFENSDHDCSTNVTDPTVLVCAPQNIGLVYVACVGEAAVDRELSVVLPADTAVCDGDFAADKYPGLAIQSVELGTWCGDQWVSNDDTCSAESFNLDTGEMVCVAGDDCGDSMCTASIPPVTVTSTGQYQAQCTYAVSDGITDPPTDPLTDPPTEDDPTSPPLTSSSCDAIMDQLQLCVDYELELSVAMECNNCVQNALDSFSGQTSCDEVEPAVCSTLSCRCGSCNDELEVTFNCLGDERGCQFECGRIDPSGSGGSSMRSYFTVVLSLISLICV